MSRLFFFLLGTIFLGAAGFIVFYKDYPGAQLPAQYVADVDNGETLFYASGCRSCHLSTNPTSPNELGGGEAFKTNFGTFYAPNISTSSTYGIGSWTFEDFYVAMKHGQNPTGSNYFPVFPYSSYSLMNTEDIADLWSYLQTLPAVDTPSKKHDLRFPFNIRETITVWNMLYADNAKYSLIDDRATYLVEALGHCAQCHTPRNILGGLKTGAWLKGGKNPSGKGKIPSIHPSDLKWNKEEIVEYLSSGFTPDYDVAGGKMASVVENTSRLSESDRIYIAEYLLRLNDE